MYQFEKMNMQLFFFDIFEFCYFRLYMLGMEDGFGVWAIKQKAVAEAGRTKTMFGVN